MSVAIGVCFGKMGSLHEGLGEYGMQYGEHLARRAPELAARHGIRFSFRLPGTLHGVFGDAVDYLPQHGIERFVSLYARRFDLWHLLHQHNPFCAPLGARRVLATVHDLNHLYGSDERFRRKASRRLARIAAAADQFVAISEHTRRDLQRVIGGERSVSVVPNGVRDLTAVAAERPLGLPAEVQPGRYFFHLSRMAPLKNPEALLRLMALMPEHTLVMAGPRSGVSEAVAARVASLGLNRVHVLFDVSTAHKAWLLANCQAFMFPSLAEGFGLPPIEAMQFGRPVFLSSLTSLPEIGGPVASFWPDFAPEAMRAVVQSRLASVAADPEADARRTREWAARFTWPRCIDGHLQIYLHLLGLDRGAA